MPAPDRAGRDRPQGAPHRERARARARVRARRAAYRAAGGSRARTRALTLARVDGALQLRLRHARAPGAVHLLRLVVELVVRPSLRAVRARAKAPAPARRHVARRGARALTCLARARAFLLYGPRGDLLCPFLGPALPTLAVLDVLVLTCPLRPLLHSAWRHSRHLRGSLSLFQRGSRGKRHGTSRKEMHAWQARQREEREAIRGTQGQGHVQGARGTDRELTGSVEPRRQEHLAQQLLTGRNDRAEEGRGPQGRPRSGSQELAAAAWRTCPTRSCSGGTATSKGCFAGPSGCVGVCSRRSPCSACSRCSTSSGSDRRPRARRAPRRRSLSMRRLRSAAATSWRRG